jgi:uncharacterized OB-fold protein
MSPPASERVLPLPDVQTEPYWAAARRHELHVQRCPDDGRLIHPSRPCCPECLRTDLEWTPVSGAGRVWSMCTMWADFVPGFQPPYVVADVALDEQPTLRITANIVHARPEQVRIGAPVRVVFEARSDGLVVPQFELVP